MTANWFKFGFLNTVFPLFYTVFWETVDFSNVRENGQDVPPIGLSSGF